MYIILEEYNMAYMMAICTHCGAKIMVDDAKKTDTCENCGKNIETEEVINKYKTSSKLNTNNISSRDYVSSEYYGLSTYYIGSLPVGPDTIREIEMLLKSYKKIDAIKLIRDKTGYSLRDCKNYVDNFYDIDKSKPQETPYSDIQDKPSKKKSFRHSTYSRRHNPAQSSNGCYVATCVYGSYDCSQVWVLRRYRDRVLAKTWYGRAFIRTYYAISPKIVKMFGHTRWFKKIWKSKLDNIVSNLQNKGFESTPYTDI